MSKKFKAGDYVALEGNTWRRMRGKILRVRGDRMLVVERENGREQLLWPDHASGVDTRFR